MKAKSIVMRNNFYPRGELFTPHPNFKKNLFTQNPLFINKNFFIDINSEYIENE